MYCLHRKKEDYRKEPGSVTPQIRSATANQNQMERCEEMNLWKQMQPKKTMQSIRAQEQAYREEKRKQREWQEQLHRRLKQCEAM